MKLRLLDDIEWPDEDDWPVQHEAKDIITALLHQSPRDRLGTGGSHEVKEHPYFYGVNWNSLLRQKAEFVPQLMNDEDTSYFDSKFEVSTGVYVSAYRQTLLLTFIDCSSSD